MGTDEQRVAVDAEALRSALRAKRDGAELTAEASTRFLEAAADGTATDAQCAAMLAAVFLRGMTPTELAGWTRGMVATGETLQVGDLGGPVVDKHSTGGVGDKASLPLAPALAALGCVVPMVSGRGLGHTGGTLDKLEAIPGFRTTLDGADLRRALEHARCAIVAQSANLVPADRRLYALRDEAELVEALPLVASSIVSKKLAEGLDALVLDVKFGSGAFFPDVERGRELARTMVDLSERAGTRCSALLTAMDRPLGRMVGHAVEVRESIACLEGGGPPDLRELVLRLGGELLRSAGVVDDESAGSESIAAVLDDGRARASFERMVEAQGGDLASFERDDPELQQEVLTAPDDLPEGARLAWSDVRELGLAVRVLGGGRSAAGAAIDPGVGLEVLAPIGASVNRGTPLVRVWHRSGAGLEQARRHVLAGLDLGPRKGEPRPLVLERITG